MQFSRREIARHKCLDCGINVIEAGDYCLLSAKLWKDQFGLGWNDNLCIACIEARLGRKLSMRLLDFISFPSVKGFPTSDTLLDRYGFSERRRAAGVSRNDRGRGPKKRSPAAAAPHPDRSGLCTALGVGIEGRRFPELPHQPTWEAIPSVSPPLLGFLPASPPMPRVGELRAPGRGAQERRKRLETIAEAKSTCRRGLSRPTGLATLLFRRAATPGIAYPWEWLTHQRVAAAGKRTWNRSSENGAHQPSPPPPS